MDFNKYKIPLTALALATALGTAIYFGRKYFRKEIPLLIDELDYSVVQSDFKTKISELKSQILQNGCSEERLTQIINQITKYVETKTRQLENEDYFNAKQQRQNVPFNVSVENYLRRLKDKETQAEKLQLDQQQILSSFNLTEDQVAKINEQISNHRENDIVNAFDRTDLDYARASLKYRTQYIKQEGQTLVNTLISICKNWQQQNVAYVPHILNIIINQRVNNEHPELLKSKLNIAWAIQSFNNDLKQELEDWENASSPLFQKIITELYKTE